MRLAYYIAVHRNIEQFRWTFSAVYNKTDLYAINIDRKAGKLFLDEVKKEVKGKSNVCLLSNQSVAWSGWSFCRAELRALRSLLMADPSWSYYINLSGQCYPIKPMELIRESLTKSFPQNFIGTAAFRDIAETHPNDPHLKRRLVVELGGQIRFTGLRWPSNVRVCHKGPAWHILSRQFCEWIFLSGALSSIPLSLRYTFCPDELLFQMFFANSPYRREIAAQKAREVIWPGPKVLTMEDWPIVSRSAAFFARKFDCHRDGQILERLADVNRLCIPHRSTTRDSIRNSEGGKSAGGSATSPILAAPMNATTSQ